MTKLTKTSVDNLKVPATGDNWLWDSDLEGFGVRVQASGRKTYVVRYRVRNATRTQRKQTIARCTDMAPDKARELARKVFAQVASGIDPLQARRGEKTLPTVADLRDRYMAEHAKPFKKPRSAALDEKNWRLHIIPFLGSKNVQDVSKADILSLAGSLSEKSATGNQVIALLSKAFNLAEEWDWRDRNTNPCYRVRKYDIPEHELILTMAQIERLQATIAELVANDEITAPTGNLFRILMLTGCRLREIMHARREWVDHDRSMLLLPDSKTGQRKIALSTAVMEIIDSMPDNEWLIPGRGHGEPLMTPYPAWKLIKARADLPPELRIHDLRHTAGSLGHQAGLSQKQIQIMLGHKQMATTERYLHGSVGDESIIAAKMAMIIGGASLPG